MAASTVTDSRGFRSVPFNPLLCDKCQCWNDVEYLCSEPGRVSAVKIPLHVRSHPKCLICDAVFAAANARLTWERAQQGRFHAGNFSACSYGSYFLDNNKSASNRINDWRSDGFRLRLVIRFQIAEEPTIFQTLLDMIPRFCLQYTPTSPTQLLSVGPWESPFFDIGLLKSWIHTCESIHTDLPLAPTHDGSSMSLSNEARRSSRTPQHNKLMHSLGTALPDEFRLIDVQSMSIKNIQTLMNTTKFTSSQRFVALSYMWPSDDENGHKQLTRSNFAALETDNGLNFVALPRIVSDAILLCRALDEPYLWVDRLCIIQDDEASKQGQIDAMDFIYNSATFTIMAALNNRRSDTGLPGCPGRPRLPSAMQPHGSITNISSYSVVTVRDIRIASVDETEWDRRGWTFQERLLSRRRLFITEFEAIFQCSDGTAHEEHSYKPGRAPPHSNEAAGSPRNKLSDGSRTSQNNEPEGYSHTQLQHLRLPRFRKGQDYDYPGVIYLGQLEWRHYKYCVQEYTKRQLSKRSDVLKAFSGVGNVLKRGLGSEILYGIPEKYFSLALRWDWTPGAFEMFTLGGAADLVAEDALHCAPSWSWASAKHFVTLPRHFEYLAYFGLIDFYRYDPEQSEQELPPRKIHGKDFCLDRDAESSSISNPFHEFVSKTPLLNLAPIACNVARKDPKALIFNTATATCQIRRTNPRNSYADYLYSRETGERVGKIRSSDKKWWNAPLGRQGRQDDDVTVEIAVIGGTGMRANISPQSIAEAWLEVLLVERDPYDLSGVAVRRIGTGDIYWSRWQSCNFRWETVVLT